MSEDLFAEIRGTVRPRYPIELDAPYARKDAFRRERAAART